MRTSRSSSTSSTYSSPSESTHHIFVKLLSGETIPLTIPTSTPLPHLQHLLSLRTSAPAPSIRLTYAGRHLTSAPPASPPSTTTTTTTTTPSPASFAPSPLPSTLSQLPQNALLHLSLPLLGGTSPSDPSQTSTTATTTNITTGSTPPHNPRRKQKCTFKDCKSQAQRIVGDCSFCQGHFCGNHRMLEDHKCDGLEDCKQEAHERNREVLEGGKTVAVRGI